MPLCSPSLPLSLLLSAEQTWPSTHETLLTTWKIVAFTATSVLLVLLLVILARMFQTKFKAHFPPRSVPPTAADRAQCSHREQQREEGELDPRQVQRIENTGRAKHFSGMFWGVSGGQSTKPETDLLSLFRPPPTVRLCLPCSLDRRFSRGILGVGGKHRDRAACCTCPPGMLYPLPPVCVWPGSYVPWSIQSTGRTGTIQETRPKVCGPAGVQEQWAMRSLRQGCWMGCPSSSATQMGLAWCLHPPSRRPQRGDCHTPSWAGLASVLPGATNMLWDKKCPQPSTGRSLFRAPKCHRTQARPVTEESSLPWILQPCQSSPFGDLTYQKRALVFAHKDRLTPRVVPATPRKENAAQWRRRLP